MGILNGLRYLKQRLSPYRPLVEVGISRANLLRNLHAYQEHYQDIRIAPVLKSNAYGHDMGLVARLLDKEDIAFFMVDSYFEARRLRSAGIKSRIVVMGYVRPMDVERSRLADVDFAITDIGQLREFAELLTRPARFHLKVDTGMHRQGILPKDIPEATALIRSNLRISLVGICSHLADADNKDEAFSDTQIEVWLSALTEVEREFPALTYRHLSATKGARFATRARTNVARVGIGLYGLDTSHRGNVEVQPVLELRSFVTSLRDLSAGEHVGYNATYETQAPVRIATVPIGYFEGYDRRLSNKGSMLVGGSVCPVAGRVSMNMSSLDVTNAKNVKRGDRVVAISRDPAHPNSIANILHTISTPGYEESAYVMLVRIPQHLRRVVE